jgi:hypothetical protein
VLLDNCLHFFFFEQLHAGPIHIIKFNLQGLQCLVLIAILLPPEIEIAQGIWAEHLLKILNCDQSLVMEDRTLYRFHDESIYHLAVMNTHLSITGFSISNFVIYNNNKIWGTELGIILNFNTFKLKKEYTKGTARSMEVNIILGLG